MRYSYFKEVKKSFAILFLKISIPDQISLNGNYLKWHRSNRYPNFKISTITKLFGVLKFQEILDFSTPCIVFCKKSIAIHTNIHKLLAAYRKLLLSHGSYGGGLALQVPILVPFPPTLHRLYRADDRRFDAAIRFSHRLHLLLAQTARGPYVVRPRPPLQGQIQGRIVI